MGSLVPGWDADALGLPPKELQEHDDMPPSDQGGYFARLERSKTLRRAAAAEDTDDTRVLRCAASEHVPDLAPTPPCSIPRAQTLQRSSVGTKHTYQPTNWESELKALQPQLSRTSLESGGARYPGGTRHHGLVTNSLPAGGGWWSTLDAGPLNRTPPRLHTADEEAEEQQVLAGSGRSSLERCSVKLDFGITGTSLGRSLM